MNSLLHDIETFCADRNMSASTFGQLARGDRHLVRQMRDGRRTWPETEVKIRKFMAEYVATQAAA
jgi:hypothetical protein